MSDSSPKKYTFTIKQAVDGEPIIPKKLYDLVRKTHLPYDEILFYYFQRVFFILIFAYFLYIMISLAQTSRVPGSIQVTSTIAATSLPFIIDFVWKRNSDEQKEADSIALQSKLKRILRVRSSNDKTGVIKVQYKDKQNNSEELPVLIESCCPALFKEDYPKSEQGLEIQSNKSLHDIGL